MNNFLKDFLSTRKALVENGLKEYLHSSDVCDELCSAMKYSVFSGGKRFRPIVAMAACETLGGDKISVLPFACSLEFIHCYSLIHDDLPCMDDDDLRRGKPTNHKVYGEATAVLAGDALLTLAFEIASKKLNPPLDNQIEIINLMATASGLNGMVGGQKLDMDAEGKNSSFEVLKKIHLHKTGKLIQCATLVGALCAGASKEEYSKMRDFGENLGFAFQISDDILDFEGRIPGKNQGGDIKNSKSTFATVLGVEKSKEILNNFTNKALESLDLFGSKADILRELTHHIADRIKA